MAGETSRRDPNYVHTLMGVDLTTGLLPTKVYVDETTHRLLVNAVISGGGASDGAIVDGSGSGLKATVLESTAVAGKYGLVVLNSDGSNVSGGGGGGGGTQYAQGVTTTPATGNVILGRYNTTLPTLTDGQLSTPQLDTRGGLQVVITDRDGTAGAAVGSASTNQLTNGIRLYTNSATYGQFDDTSPGALTEDRMGIQRMSANRNAYTTIRDAAGNERGVNITSSNELNVIATAQPGVDIGDVTINNASGASAVNIQDGGNSITVDGTVAATQSGTWTVQPGNTANTTAWLVTGTGGTFPITDSGGSITVDNGGTFVVQATLAAETTKVIGTVNQGTSPWIVSGTVTANLAAGTNNIGDVDVLTVGGQTPAFGTGARSAATQRVTIATDDVVPASQSGTWNIGTVTTVTAVTAITNALPAGTNAIGKLSANSGVDIGDVDVTTVGTITPGTAATSLGKAEDAAHASGDVGVFALGVRNDNLATTYGADQDYAPLATDLKGRVMVAQKAATATLSNVAASATSVTVLAANSARIGATITNDSSAVVYLKFGATASTTSYTVVLAGAASAPFSYYEVPAGYTGIIDGLSASATGNYRVTEIT